MVRNGCLNYLKHRSIVEKYRVEYLAKVDGEEKLYYADFMQDAEHKLLYDVIPNEILDNIENILGGDLENISDEVKNDYISKLKVIPFTSLGKQNGILLGIKADELIVEEMNSEKKIDKVIIGIYNKEFSKKRTYSALIGIDVI